MVKVPLNTKKYLLFSVIILLFSCIIFTNFADELIGDELFKFDQMVIDSVLLLVSPKLTVIMKFFTFLGSSKVVPIILFFSCVLMVFNKKKWEATFLLFGVAGGVLFNELLKEIFHRQRPTLHRIIEENGYSFPSGHSMVSFILYGMLCMFIITFLFNRAMKIIIVGITAFIIFMIGLSRVYLGVHYPSDVLAGFAAGSIWLIICLLGLQAVKNYRKKKVK